MHLQKHELLVEESNQQEGVAFEIMLVLSNRIKDYEELQEYVTCDTCHLSQVSTSSASPVAKDHWVILAPGGPSTVHTLFTTVQITSLVGNITYLGIRDYLCWRHLPYIANITSHPQYAGVLSGTPLQFWITSLLFEGRPTSVTEFAVQRCKDAP